MTRSDQGIDFDRERVEVRPVPTHDEASAIVAAIRSAKRRERAVDVAPPSGWRVAARHEAIHSELDVGRDGWRLTARLEP